MKALDGFTVADVMDCYPECYDEAEVRERFNGRKTMTARGVLLHPDIKTDDVRWLLLREGWLPDSLMRRYAAICAAIAMGRYGNDDPRSWRAIDVALGVADGTASEQERAAARAEAGAAAWDVGWGGAAAAAWDAAWGAAVAADRDAAWGAARGAVRDAQREILLALIEEGRA